jgi:acyl-coenzyme A thioesterase PaaI-like protein
VRGAELISEFLRHSPFVGHLGMELREIEDDRCLLALPFTEAVVTIGDVVHGGADGKLVATGLVTYKLS